MPQIRSKVPAVAKPFKVGTRVRVDIGVRYVATGVVAGRPAVLSNGGWVPVCISDPGVKPKDIRSYRAAYLTAV